jgi:hypothetical protein
MAINLFGKWRLEVVKAIHNWENRYVIEGASSGNGAFNGVISPAKIIDGHRWQLRAEYRENNAAPWKPSAMKIDVVPDRVDIHAIIGSEDPLPQIDYEDIQWDARWLGDTLFDIPVRPFAVRILDLGQMPDGIFETAIGIYYMGVRVENHWGLTFGPDHVIAITPQSRALLAAGGVDVIDSFTQHELDMLGQKLSGAGISLEGLEPDRSRIVYFKIDVRDAAARKHKVTFSVTNRAGMADAADPRRFRTKDIFVSSSFIDETTGQIVSRVQEGEIRVNLREVAIDRITAKKKRRRLDGSDGKGGGATSRRRGRHRNPGVKELRRALEALLGGKDIDPCVIKDLLSCYCDCRHAPGFPGGVAGGFDPSDPWGGGRDPRFPGDGKWQYPPFLAFPTKFDYTVTPAAPYGGQYGPLPFDDPWWKVLLIIIAVVLLIAGMIAEAADIAYQDEDNVIGTLGAFQQDDIDAALCVIDTDRALSMTTVLDAQSDENFLVPLTALDGTVSAVSGNVLTHAEIATLLMLPFNDPQRKVFKSGATSGFTHGIMTGLSPFGHPEATWNIDQLQIALDPAFGEPTSQPGDSGSVWIHTATLRPVGLNHSGSSDGSGAAATASLLEDVQRILNITI